MLDAMHTAIRDAECNRSWPTLLAQLLPKMEVTPDGATWACIASCLDAFGDLPALASHITKYERLLENASPEIRSFNFYMIGRLHQSLGEYDLALAAYMRSSALGETPEMRVLPLLQTGTINSFLDQHEEAVSNLRSASVQIRERQDNVALAHAYDFLSSVFNKMGQSENARNYLELARKEASKAPRNEYRLAWISFTDGEIRFKGGDPEVGIARMRASLGSFRKGKNRGAELHASIRLASCLISLRRCAEARVLVDRAVALGQTFRHNISRIRVLRLKAELARELDGLDQTAFDHATRRAAILEQRARKSWSLLKGRGRIFSDEDVLQFLSTLNPPLFDATCVRILASRQYAMKPAPPNDASLSFIAVRHTGGHVRIQWAVLCLMREATLADVPSADQLRAGGCRGMMIMTASTISEDADRAVDAMRSEGVLAKVWASSDIARFLARHDEIMSDIGTNL